MRNHFKFVLVALIGLGVAAQDVAAQTTNISPAATDRAGRVVAPDPPPTDGINALSVKNRPSRPEQNKLPAGVMARIDRFKLEAQRYLEQQQLLKKRLLGANDQERAKIREQLTTLRERWLEQAREMRTQFRERQQELMDKLPGYRELLETVRRDARAQLRDARKDAQGPVRDRRGDE